MKSFLSIALILSVVALASCSTAPKRDGVIKGSPFERADANADMSIDYKEYKNYLFYKAESNTVERERLRQDAANGSVSFHKSFLVLDTNNDGKLSLTELGGGA